VRVARRKGAALVIVLSILFILGILTSTLVAHLAATLRIIETKRNRVKAFHIAEGGIQKALWELARNPDYQGEAETALGSGFFTVRFEKIKGEMNSLCIISTGRLDKVDARHPQQTISAVVEIGPAHPARIGTAGEERSPVTIKIRRFEMRPWRPLRAKS